MSERRLGDTQTGVWWQAAEYQRSHIEPQKSYLVHVARQGELLYHLFWMERNNRATEMYFCFIKFRNFVRTLAAATERTRADHFFCLLLLLLESSSTRLEPQPQCC
jgi:hypothetical protein